MMHLNFKKILFLSLATALVQYASAQVKIGDNATIINRSAVLDLESTNKGLLLPRVNITNTGVWGLASTTSRPPGMLVYNTNANTAAGAGYPVRPGGNTTGLYYWDGTGWVPTNSTLTGAADPNTPAILAVAGQVYVRTNGTIYVHNGTTWLNSSQVSGANGLTATDGEVTLGGTLDRATTIVTANDPSLTLAIATGNRNNFAITGLVNDAPVTNKIVTVDANGVLKTRDIPVTPTGVRTISNAYGVDDTDQTLLINAGSDFTINLPVANAANTGRTLILRRVVDSEFVTTLDQEVFINSSGLATGKFQTFNYGTWKIQCDGVKWNLVN